MTQVTAVLEKARTNDQGYCSFLANDVWYGTYKTDYSALEGQTVTFKATQKGQYHNASDVKPATNGAAPAAAPARVAAPAPDNRQASIVLQSSYKTAADLLGNLVAADKVALGAKGKAYDAAIGLLDELAAHIFRSCINPQRFFENLSGGDAPEEEESDEAPAGKPWNPTEV
jgi:hypothetical protein